MSDTQSKVMDNLQAAIDALAVVRSYTGSNDHGCSCHRCDVIIDDAIERIDSGRDLIDGAKIIDEGGAS